MFQYLTLFYYIEYVLCGKNDVLSLFNASLRLNSKKV